MHLEVRQTLWAENHKLGGMWQRHSQHCCLICFYEKQKQNGELRGNFLNALPEFLNLHSSKILHCLASVPHQVNEYVTYLS